MTTFDFTSGPVEPEYGYANTPVEATPVSAYEPEPSVEPEIQQNPQSPSIDLSQYSFWIPVEGLKSTYNDANCPEFCVDITISLSTPDHKTIPITKRVKFCKESLIREALCKDGFMDASATFVESVEEKTENKHSTQRMLELAGINHPQNYVR
jgi:hypothetical protein